VSEYNYGNANYVNDKILNVIFTLKLQFYVVLRGWGLCSSISYFLATRSSQMNAEAASDVDPEY